MTLYVRVEKVALVELKEGMTYKDAIQYGHALDSKDCLEYDLYVDIIDDNGEVVNESGWNE